MTTEDDEAGKATYGLVMPFVVVASKGGPYDDLAYAAGWEAGHLDAALGEQKGYIVTLTARTDNLAQLDLVAMRHRYKMTTTATEIPEWTEAVFTPA